MVRFLHTSDWQLGMTRYMLSEGAQERFNQARFDAIRTLGKIAAESNCQFVVVCGDAFESNQVDRKTVARALEALKEVPLPVWILPGNHDPLNEASVYSSKSFVQGKPANVNMISDATPIQVDHNVELVGAPWLSKRMPVNPFYEATKSLEPLAGVIRIIVAHGIVDLFTPKKDDLGVLTADSLERVIGERKASFVALGDRHSLTKIGEGERIWYSGTPEVTDFGEGETGYVQIVELDGDKAIATPALVGQWSFVDKNRVDINCSEDIEGLQSMLESIERKERTVLRLNLGGSISLTQEAILRQFLATISDVFASFQMSDNELLVLPDDADFSSLNFSGFAEATVRQLREKMVGEGMEKRTARDALALLVRLNGGLS
ncbi:MAG: DNA repair exonuclease [Dehalococcoidia bacterium]|nr:DNA repair exonuclease [Dehalococcoidia bacterium]